MWALLSVPLATHAFVNAVPVSAATSEKRIARLERLVLQLQRQLSTQKSGRVQSRPGGAAKAAPVKELVSVAPSATALSSSQPDPRQAARDLTPSEFNVFRDSAATLAQHKFEASVGAAYSKRTSLLQSDRSASGFANIRYGLFDGIELAFNVPVYLSSRSTQIGIGRNLTERLAGVGDISAQISALAFRETVDFPALVATAGVTAPTGKSPITFGANYAVGQNPVDPFKGYQSRGDYAGSLALQIYKTIDPIIVFAGGGVDYALPQSIQGFHLRYAPRYNYNMGFAFAVNEKTTIGFQVNGSTEANFKVDGKAVKNTAQEPIVARLVVVQRIAADTYLEPNVGFGLTSDAADVAIGLTLRRRF